MFTALNKSTKIDMCKSRINLAAKIYKEVNKTTVTVSAITAVH